jgi:outer membrane lipoprotein-sorting protein
MQPNVRRVRTKPAGKPTMGSVFISCAAVAVVLTGSASPPAIAQATKSVSAAAQPSPEVTPPPLLEAFARAWNDVTAYSATVSVFSAKGADAQNIVFDYTFRKPSSFIVHVVAGPNAGVTLTWNGGPTVQASRGRGLFSLLKRTIPLHDPLVTTVRAESIDQLSYGAILAHAEQTPGMLDQSPGESIAGTPTQALSLVPSDPAADAGLSREVIEISTATALPIRIEGYEGHTLVRKIDFSDVQPEK